MKLISVLALRHLIINVYYPTLLLAKVRSLCKAKFGMKYRF